MSIQIELNGTVYTEGSKCLACSSERDNGGRFVLKKRLRHYLKCQKCGYSIKSVATRKSVERYHKSLSDRGIIK